MASELISFRPNSIVLIIAPPTGTGSGASGNPRGEVWTARFLYYGSEPPPGMAAYRAWFLRETHRFLNSEPRVDEELNGRKPLSGAIDVTDWISMIETALVLFALYFMAFNIFMTSTGEEREKRILLALLLTPARPVEIVAAKGIFYAAGSLLVATAIVAMYHPSYLATTAFWPTVILGSLCYLSIATVFLSIVRRQTTITMISMLYLISTLIIMILGEPYALPMPFYFLRGMLVEHYLHSLIFQIMSDQRGFTFGWYLIILLGLTFVWGVIAVITFSRKGIAISQGR